MLTEVMARSFGIVEEKLEEAAFFLDRFASSDAMSFEGRCYFSAFVSASRSVTFALQVSLADVDGFPEWYAQAQKRLRTDPLARFFKELRDDSIHKGVNRLDRVGLKHLRESLRRQLAGDRAPQLIIPSLSGDSDQLVDAIAAATSYFCTLVEIVYDCWVDFRYVVDARWYYTAQNFEKLGKTFDDAVSELGFPRPWATCAPAGEEHWRVLRHQQSPCQLNGLFRQFLGKEVPDPDCANESA